VGEFAEKHPVAPAARAAIKDPSATTTETTTP
jgi:hypothetical protein